MAYKLITSNRANEQIDNILSYVAIDLHNPGAARALAIDIYESFNRIEEMADTYGYCEDLYLRFRGYRKKRLKRHNYIIIYRIEGNKVHISGVFHLLEDYAKKL